MPEALILQASTVAGTVEGDAPAVRVAYVVDDAAQFTAEASEIPEALPTLAECVVHVGKITQLIRVSNEQFGQQGTDLQLSLSAQRAVVKMADFAFLAQPDPSPAVQPSTGLLNIPGLIAGGEIYQDLDPLLDVQAEIQVNGGTPTHIIMDPLGFAEVRKLKVADGWHSTLTGAGVTDAIPLLLGLPVLVNRFAPPYSGLLIDRAAVVSAVGTVNVAVSTDRYFEYDSSLLRITWSIGQNVVRPDRCGTFTVAGPGS